RRDRFLRIERGKPAREIFKLAHVARPAVVLQSLKRGRLELLARQSLALDLSEEVPDQIGHVFDAFTQRRQAQRHDIEAEEQILAEKALLDEDAQGLVGCCDYSH